VLIMSNSITIKVDFHARCFYEENHTTQKCKKNQCTPFLNLYSCPKWTLSNNPELTTTRANSSLNLIHLLFNIELNSNVIQNFNRYSSTHYYIYIIYINAPA